MPNNLATRLQENAGRFPDRPVFLYPERNRAWKTITYRQLHERSQLYARGLTAYALCPGTRAVLMLPPSLDFFALVFALLQTGIVPVIVDPAIGLRNVTRCLTEAEPEVYFGSTMTHNLRRLFGWGKASLRLNLSLADVARAAQTAPEFQPPQLTPESEAAIIYTSGSTGLAKGAIYTHANFEAQIEMLVESLHLNGDEIDLPAFPLFALIDCLLGVTAVIPDPRFPAPARINPQRMLAAIRTQSVNSMFASPVVLDKLARYGAKNQVKLPGLKQVMTAGAPAPAAVLAMFRQMLPEEAVLVGVYGSTETLPVSIVDSREILGETRYLSARGAGVCIGRPVPGAQVQIIAISDQALSEADLRPLTSGQIGEITVKGPAVTAGYLGREQLNQLAKIRIQSGEIIHRMGDVGYFDVQGRLWYCGRKSHRVVTPAGTLFSESIEGIFNAHPQVYRSALVGVEQAGVMQPVLWAELDPSARGADQEQIRAELLELAGANAMTNSIKTILFHPAFPTDIRHNSKIIREKLAVLAKKRLR